MMFGYAGFVGSGSSGRCEGCGVVLGEGKEQVSAPPWIGSHAEEVEPDSSFSEAAQKRAIELLQRKCSQGLCEKHCPDCAEAHGHKRKCRRLSPEDVGKGTLYGPVRASPHVVFWTQVFLGGQLEYAGG